MAVAPEVWSLTACPSAPPTLLKVTLLHHAVGSLSCRASHHVQLGDVWSLPVCPWYKVSSGSSYAAPHPPYSSACSWCFTCSQLPCTPKATEQRLCFLLSPEPPALRQRIYAGSLPPRQHRPRSRGTLTQAWLVWQVRS